MISLLNKSKSLPSVMGITKIIQEATAYISNSTECLNNSIDIQELKDELWKLRKLDLRNTKNYRMMSNILSNIEKATSLLEYIHKVDLIFDSKAILISQESFDNLLSEYKLSIGLLSNYTGAIPHKNIEELCHVYSVLGGNDSNINGLKLNIRDKETNGIYVKEAVSSYDLEPYYEKSLVNALDSYHRILWVPSKKIIRGSVHVRDLRDYYPDPVIQEINNIQFTGIVLSSDTLLIACPKSLLKDTPLTMSNKAVDPIVFQYCPWGVLVYSVWGEEAESQILKEYINLYTQLYGRNNK